MRGLYLFESPDKSSSPNYFTLLPERFFFKDSNGDSYMYVYEPHWEDDPKYCTLLIPREYC